MVMVTAQASTTSSGPPTTSHMWGTRHQANETGMEETVMKHS
jgi:hypothetical protein